MRLLKLALAGILAVVPGCSKEGSSAPRSAQGAATGDTESGIEAKWQEYRKRYSVIYTALQEGEQFPEQLVHRYSGRNPIRDRAWKPLMPYEIGFEKNDDGVWAERIRGKVTQVEHDNVVTVERPDGTSASVFYFPPTEKVATGDEYDALCERTETTIDHPTHGRIRRYDYLNPMSLDVFRFFWNRGSFSSDSDK